jgi:hypothetical protein
MRDKSEFAFLATILLFLWTTVCGSSQGQGSRSARVALPTDKTESIPSPDGNWVLIASPLAERTILLENRTEKHRTLVKAYNRSLQVGWSPDSKAFFVNDAYGSNLEDAFVYWVDSKEPLLLNDLVLNHDREASAISADHAYFRVRRWINAKNLQLEYCGHNGEAPGQQFDFIYNVALEGSHGNNATTRRVSHKIGPLDWSVRECRP